MVYKCLNCDSSLEYNPVNDRMECTHCGSAYSIDELGAGNAAKKDFGEVITEEEAGEQISCKVYTCTSCGAEVVINDVEVSTFCIYCGQPTIVFKRMQDTLMPKYIVPFRIQKDQVVSGLKERIHKSIFIPKSVKEFNPEMIRGIYVPYWLYDVSREDYQIWEVGSGESASYVGISGSCEFESLPVDASDIFQDEISQKLEPFDLRCKKPFQAEYLAGFYADMYDKDAKELESVAKSRAKELFDDEMRKQLHSSVTRLMYFLPITQIQKTDYALLPVWFITFRHDYVPYTILINGQNGKIVGTFPFDKKRFILMITIMSVLFSMIFSVVYMCLLPPGELFAALIPIVMINGIIYFLAYLRYVKLRKNLMLTQARDTLHYAKERQER